jgi:hypothetical protein
MALAGAMAFPAFAQGGGGTGGGGGGGAGGGGAQNGVFVLKVDSGVSTYDQRVTFLANGMVRARQNGGAGNEHLSLTVSHDGTKLIGAYASNNTANPSAPQQLKMVVIQMSATGAPKIVAQSQMTQINSDRNQRFGHPAIAKSAVAGQYVVAYGANDVQGNNNTQTYAFVVDENLKDLTTTTPNNPSETHIVLDQDPNNNIAAPRLVFDGAKILGGIYKNNDAEYGFLVGTRPSQAGGVEPYLLSDNQRLTPSNIGRPTILAMSTSRALYCAPRGNNRPSEQGDECRLLNTDVAALTQNGNGATVMPQLWKKIMVQAIDDPNNQKGIDGLPGALGGKGVYPSSPTITATEVANEVSLATFISLGQGRNRNKKGTSIDYVSRWSISDTGATLISEANGLATESSHVVATFAHVGIVGAEQPVLTMMGSPISSFGASALTHITHNSQLATGSTGMPANALPAQKAFQVMETAAVSPGNSDGGYLSNMLGRNPGTQGRQHLNVLADVTNLGYHQSFMQKTKTFFVVPWAGRVNMTAAGAQLGSSAPQVAAADGRTLPEDRNAMFISFVSATRDADAPAPPAAQPPGANDGTPGSSTVIPGTPGSDTAGSNGTDNGPGGFSGGCTYGGTGDAGALALLLVGGVLLLISRRRWA